MKKFTAAIISLSLAASSLSALSAPVFCACADSNEDLTVGCKSAYLCDYYSGECVYKQNECARMPIASVCKVMTLILCFDAVEEGKLALTDNITVSERASGMGGSQVFLQKGLSYPLNELIKSIIVCSANDSCVAVSEAVCGTEEQFVALMNKRAEELGCADTLFANCTGLPKDTQYSCAKDVAVMFSNLISRPKYFDYSGIWLEDFSHPDNRTTTMTNTNKLIKKYPSCDGGKTGFTNEAGFCLASTAQKGDSRLVSVVLGADSSDNRFKSAVNLFNYGFANYNNKIVLDCNVNLNERMSVECGKKESISVKAVRNCYVFCKNGTTPEITRNVVINSKKAPVAKGECVGYVEIYKDGIICDTVDLVAAEDVERCGFKDNFKKVANNWAM